MYPKNPQDSKRTSFEFFFRKKMSYQPTLTLRCVFRFVAWEHRVFFLYGGAFGSFVYGYEYTKVR